MHPSDADVTPREQFGDGYVDFIADERPGHADHPDADAADRDADAADCSARSSTSPLAPLRCRGRRGGDRRGHVAWRSARPDARAIRCRRPKLERDWRDSGTIRVVRIADAAGEPDTIAAPTPCAR